MCRFFGLWDYTVEHNRQEVLFDDYSLRFETFYIVWPTNQNLWLTGNLCTRYVKTFWLPCFVCFTSLCLLHAKLSLKPLADTCTKMTLRFITQWNTYGDFPFPRDFCERGQGFLCLNWSEYLIAEWNKQVSIVSLVFHSTIEDKITIQSHF